MISFFVSIKRFWCKFSKKTQKSHKFQCDFKRLLLTWSTCTWKIRQSRSDFSACYRCMNVCVRVPMNVLHCRHSLLSLEGSENIIHVMLAHFSHMHGIVFVCVCVCVCDGWLNVFNRCSCAHAYIPYLTAHWHIHIHGSRNMPWYRVQFDSPLIRFLCRTLYLFLSQFLSCSFTLYCAIHNV